MLSSIPCTVTLSCPHPLPLFYGFHTHLASDQNSHKHNKNSPSVCTWRKFWKFGTDSPILYAFLFLRVFVTSIETLMRVAFLNMLSFHSSHDMNTLITFATFLDLTPMGRSKTWTQKGHNLRSTSSEFLCLLISPCTRIWRSKFQGHIFST